MLKNQGYDFTIWYHFGSIRWWKLSLHGNSIFPSFIWFWQTICKPTPRRSSWLSKTTMRKNEDGQPYELFGDLPWSSYLNEIRLNGTHSDHITLDSISRINNVHIQIISSLGLQVTVNMNQENGWHTMVLGHYAECRRARWPLCLLKIHAKFWLFKIRIWRTYFWYWQQTKLDLINIPASWTTYKLNLTNTTVTGTIY